MKRLLLVLICVCGASTASVGGNDEVGLLELFNYYEYSPYLLSSGQPTREQFPLIRAAGVEAIINLAPVTDPGALPDEQQLAAALGLDYVHIPVNWDHPPLADVDSFLAAMQRFQGKHVLVHCYAGSRASAFTFVYRVRIQGEPRDKARAVLESIWANNPGYELPVVPQWRQLIDDALVAHRP